MRYGVLKTLVSGLILSVSVGCGSQSTQPILVTCNSPTPAAEADSSGSEETPPGAATTPSTAPPEASAAPWWEYPYPERFDASQLENKLPFIRVQKNRFVDEKGTPVVFQGVSIADPDKLQREGQWNRRLFEAVGSWGANVVRVPIHPAAWRGVGKAAYFELIDQAVVWASTLGLYLIIDWHSIGNLATELFQHPMYETSKAETLEFWRSVSFRYQGISTVAFYELFNEPTVYNGNLGAATWAEWKAIVEEMIDIIYSHDKKVIPLVGGFNWAYELGPVKDDPVDREGIAYASHPYPQKTTAPFEKNWDKSFGFVAKTYPLFATEIGYMPADAPGAHIPVKDDGSYGKRMTGYLDKKGASWAAWCFHPHWAPPLISDWEYTPTPAGAHFRSVMLQRKKKK